MSNSATLSKRKVYKFGTIRYDPASHQLTSRGTRIPIEAKPLTILATLLQRPNDVFTKEELLKAAWPWGMVPEQSLTTAIAKLRYALSPDQQYIQTVRGVGYRLSGDVSIHWAAGIKGSKARDIVGKNPNGAKKTGKIPVQEVFILTPLFINDIQAGEIASLTIRFPEALHNVMPDILARKKFVAPRGWRIESERSGAAFLSALASDENGVDRQLRRAIVDALDEQCAAIRFSSPKPLTTENIAKLASSLMLVQNIKAKKALVGTVTVSACIILIQVSWGIGNGLHTAADYFVTEIGRAMVDQVVLNIKNHGIMY